MPLARLFIPLLALPLFACPATDADGSLELTFTGLDPLAEGFVYEGWILVDGAPVSAGRFDAPDGSFSVEFELDADDLDLATAYILTIEPEPDSDPAPSAVHLLAGDFTDGEAHLHTGHAAALGSDFLDAAGSYILETPTSAEADDYDQGIWWLDPSSGAPMASLELPELPEGWTYEGWVVVDGSPISTGTFAFADEEDSDGPGLAAGPAGTPPFPGQDFVEPATVLLGGAAVLSVEPVPDTSAAPFVLKPLMDGSIEDMGQGGAQDMDNIADSAPMGHATVL